MGQLTVYTRVGNNGQEITAFELPFSQQISAQEISIHNNYKDSSIECFLAMKTDRTSDTGVRNLSQENGLLHIDVSPFAFLSPYELQIKDQVLTAKDVCEVKTEWADRFAAIKEGEVLYRLYEPDHTGPRPLILFLHGGGESGNDNWRQLVACFGPTKLAESYPDCYVMAPQAKGAEPTPEEIEAFKKLTFATSDQRTDIGWNREYLAKICDIIRRMIREGKVNPRRVYVTGLSMGGAGTIRAMAVGADLFAAAVPVCPSMTPETFRILCGLTSAKLWITAAYIDHTLYRHKYLVDGIMALRDAGNRNAKLTLFSPEELAKYGIGTIPDMPLEALFGWNHTCWIPTYHNEHGVMAWMMEQVNEKMPS